MPVLLIIFSLLVGFFSFPSAGVTAMTSTNFQIQWDTVGQGGSDTSSSSTYLLRDTVGNTASGSSVSSSYNLEAGYRAGIFDQILSFNVQALLSATQMTASSRSGNTVTVNSTSSLSVNDLIVLIQNKGTSEIDAMGKVISKTDTTFTVDAWAHNGTLPTIDVSNDYAYVLSGNTAALGTLSTSDVATSVIGWDVSADLLNGYTVSVFEDGDLRSGSVSLSDVTDGTVNAGSEEYGARSSDVTLTNSAFDTQDAALTTSFQEVATESSVSFDRRNFLILKAGISSTSDVANYSQTLSFVVSGNF